MPRVATSDAIDSVGDSLDDSVSLNGLFRVYRATGVKSARPRQKWRDKFSIYESQRTKNRAAHLMNSATGVSAELRKLSRVQRERHRLQARRRPCAQ